MNFILYILLPMMAIALVVVLSIWRAHRVIDKFFREYQERQDTIKRVSDLGGSLHPSNAAGQRAAFMDQMVSRKREDEDITKNPLHPLNPIGIVATQNIVPGSLGREDSGSIQSQACYTGSDPHESSRSSSHSSDSWSSSSSDSSSYSSSDSGSSSSSCD